MNIVDVVIHKQYYIYVTHKISLFHFGNALTLTHGLVYWLCIPAVPDCYQKIQIALSVISIY